MTNYAIRAKSIRLFAAIAMLFTSAMVFATNKKPLRVLVFLVTPIETLAQLTSQPAEKAVVKLEGREEEVVTDSRGEAILFPEGNVSTNLIVILAESTTCKLPIAFDILIGANLKVEIFPTGQGDCRFSP